MIVGIWGPDKSCKGTLAASFPKPMVDMELDIGGFQRTCRNVPNIPIKDWYESGDIRVQQYPLPIQGVTMDPKTGAVKFTASKILMGIKELFYKFVTDYLQLLNDPDVASIQIDTGTLFYTLAIDTYTQELQERQMPLLMSGLGKDGKPLRTQLQQQEYREVYDRMRGIVYQAKVHNKFLIMTHHETDEYGLVIRDGQSVKDTTGNKVRHGWKELGDSCDLMIRTYIGYEPLDKEGNPDMGNPLTAIPKGKKRDAYLAVPYGVVCDESLLLEIRGMEFREPTWDAIKETIDGIRGE